MPFAVRLLLTVLLAARSVRVTDGMRELWLRPASGALVALAQVANDISTSDDDHKVAVICTSAA